MGDWARAFRLLPLVKYLKYETAPFRHFALFGNRGFGIEGRARSPLTLSASALLGNRSLEARETGRTSAAFRVCYRVQLLPLAHGRRFSHKNRDRAVTASASGSWEEAFARAVGGASATIHNRKTGNPAARKNEYLTHLRCRGKAYTETAGF